MIEATIHSVSDEMSLAWLQAEMDKTRARLAGHPSELRRQQREQLAGRCCMRDFSPEPRPGELRLLLANGELAAGFQARE
jgi:hypothetical protein